MDISGLHEKYSKQPVIDTQNNPKVVAVIEHNTLVRSSPIETSPSANEATTEPPHSPIKITWEAFLHECTNHGVPILEVETLFNQRDIDDLCEEPVEKTVLHAKTIVEALKRLHYKHY